MARSGDGVALAGVLIVGVIVVGLFGGGKDSSPSQKPDAQVATPASEPASTPVALATPEEPSPAPAAIEADAPSDDPAPDAPRSIGHKHHGHARDGYGGCGGEEYRSSDGSCVHRPYHTDHHVAGETAVCRDGTHSMSHHHRGTCSHHGGVASWD